MRLLAIVLATVLFSSSVVSAQPAAPKGAGPNVEIWLPPDFRSGEGPWPLIIFSHGFGGCAKQSEFLTAYLADQGYIVAAPDHADGHPCQSGIRLGEGMPEKPFRFPDQWSDATYQQRRADILFTLKSIHDDPKFKGVIDEDNIGLMGHSLGGYTVMGMAGGWPSWKDKNFKAVVALSPYAAPFAGQGTIGNIDIPVMYQGGTMDAGMTPILRDKIYPESRSPKYYVELDGAGHDGWTQKQARWQEPVNRTVLSFFNKYLKGKEGAVLPERADKGVVIYRAQEK